MPSRNRHTPATMESVGSRYFHDVPNTGEREPLLAQNTIGILSRRQVFVNYSWKVAQTNTGILFVVAAQAFFAVMEATAKILQKLDPPVTTFEIMIIRMTITYICCLIYMFIANIPDPFIGPKGIRLLLLLRGIGGAVAVFGIYYSLQYLSLSDVTVLTFFVPICTAVSGAIFLEESFKFREAIAGLVSFAGVVLIARPASIFENHNSTTIPSDTDRVVASERMKAVVVSLIGVLGTTTAYTSIRAIGKRAHPMHIMVSFSIVSLLMSSVGMVVTKTETTIPAGLHWLALLATSGIFGFLAQVMGIPLSLRSLWNTDSQPGALAVYSKIIFATILEWILFHTFPSYLSVIGTLMIVVSALYIVLTKEKTKAIINRPIHLPLSDDEALEQDLAPSGSRA